MALESALPPLHPGEVFREDVLPALELSVTEAARLLGVSRQALHAILAETASVSVPMALRLGKLCGNGPDVWLALQNKYDLAVQSKAMQEALAAIPTMQAA